MKNILIIGMDSHTIDFTNPEIPEGLTAEKIRKGAKCQCHVIPRCGYTEPGFVQSLTIPTTYLFGELIIGILYMSINPIIVIARM